MTIIWQPSIRPHKEHGLAERPDAAFHFHVTARKFHVGRIGFPVIGIVDCPLPLVRAGGLHIGQNGEAHKRPFAQGFIGVLPVDLRLPLLVKRFRKPDNRPA